jgi:hypothetical protein
MGKGKELEKIEKLLPKEYKCECQEAKRGKKKGRAARGIITGVKLGIKEKGEEEGCMERNEQIGNKWWRIMTIYSKEMKKQEELSKILWKKNRG